MKNYSNTYIKTLFICTTMLLWSTISYAQTTDTYTLTGTWLCPAEVTSVTVECWGAGGAGGGNTGSTNGAGGGGGGGYSIKTFTVVPGNSYVVNVGAGGTVVSNGKGGDAGETWFISNTATGIVAYGGIGGNPAPGGLGGAGGSAAFGTVNRTGGSGGSGNINNGGGGGGGGSSAGTSANGNNGTNASSAGGGAAGTGGAAVAGGGAGGDGGYKGTVPVVGFNPGGGGGGTGESELTNNSKAGGDGQVILTYTLPVNNAPVVNVPGAQSICANETFILGNPPSISDSDGDTQDVTISITNGTLNIIVGSLTVSGNGTNNITITKNANATLTNINNAFNGAVFTPSGSGTATIQIVTNDGKGGTDTKSFDIIVNALPNLVITNPVDVCSPNTVDLTIPSVTSGSDPGTFTYFTDAGLTISIPDETAVGAGTYYIKLTDGNACFSSGSVTVTINATPSAVSVSGGGTFCTSATLTASGGTPGTIYWQNTTSGGTSTATPSSNQIVTATGTYYFRAMNSGCWSSEGSASVTINTVPVASAITGPATVLANTNGYIYSIDPIEAYGSGATYVWTIPGNPGGWTLASGQGTNSITVNTGTKSGDDITVTVSNDCGPGNTSLLTTTIGTPPDCPASTSVAPSGIQTVCEGVATSQLTASITTSGGSGTPTLLYQWYYNASNSNTISGATKISGATASTYTPLSTAAEVGNRWYFCVGYATDNTCAQTDATQSLASNAVQVTVNPKPGIPTAITGSANVAPSAAGLIYSTTSTNADINGYTWTLPIGWSQTAGGTTNSITVTSGTNGQNGNITVTASNTCGTSAVTTKAVTSSSIDLPPTITLGPNPTSCENTLADLTYSATTDNPNLYSIDFNISAQGQGFVDVVDAIFPASPIKIVVPNNVRAGIYNANLTVKNSSSGLQSIIYLISVTVNGKPGSITGIINVNPNTQGYTYSIAPVNNAISYLWSVPTNWIITSGGTTNSIIVTSGGIGDNGNITCQADFACGTSTAITVAATVSDITNHTGINCSNCHTFHNATGSNLANSATNAGLCLSCHNTGSIAKDKPFLSTDQANSTGNKNSHAWDANAINTSYETVIPTLYNAMAIRITGGKISCSTCHDQHTGNPNNFYLRVDNTNDAMCKDCHAPRNVGTYAQSVANKGSHPIGIVYDETNTGFKLASASSLVTSNGETINCSTCHGVHDVNNTGTLTTDGNLLKFPTNDNTLCLDCHVEMTHNGMACLDCHQVHNTDKSNLYMIKSIITTPGSGDKPVVFTALTGTNNFADGDGLDGVCEVCHRTTNHFRNSDNLTGVPDQLHTSQGAGISDQNCTSCHLHSSSFAGGDCVTCHQASFPTWNVSDAHVVHNTRYGFDCSTCHFERGYGTAFHDDATADVNFNPSGMATRDGQDGNSPAFDGTTCSQIYCHSNGKTAERGWDGVGIYTWGGTALPYGVPFGGTTRVAPYDHLAEADANNYATQIIPNWTGGSITACTDCHGGPDALPPGPTYDITAGGLYDCNSNDELPYTGKHGPLQAQHTSGNMGDWGGGTTQCFWCHDTDDRNADFAGAIKKQGTYGTSFHVDGQTHFKPGWTTQGGTGNIDVPRMESPTGTHCASKTCWQ